MSSSIGCHLVGVALGDDQGAEHVLGHVEPGGAALAGERAGRDELLRLRAQGRGDFFNGFESMHHRKDGGMVGCMLEDRLTHQITCDGVHVAAPWIKLLIKLKGIDKIYGITDLFNFAGLEDGEYDNDFYGTVVISGPRCCAKKDGMLLGGNLTWDKMMKSARDTIGLSEIEVAKIYGENPCKCLGITDRGKIEVGRRSDFCIMDKDYHVQKTIIKGKIYYQI